MKVEDMFKKYIKTILFIGLVLLAFNVIAVDGVKADLYDAIQTGQLEPLADIGLPGEGDTTGQTATDKV
ncbi:MAG: hypothetical protein KAR43_00620, partial [Deltaproteobacteria bacterium]|nr:hypothetical protein [Deltaproteobacteria bacterium]